MATKTVLTDIIEEEGKDGIIRPPKNKTLYVDQFTDKAPKSDEEREGVKAKNMKEVFEKFKPSKEVRFKNGESDTFLFKSILDFEDEQLIEHSNYLRHEQNKIDTYNRVITQLEENETLKNVLKDEKARSNFYSALKALLAELETAENK